MRPDLRKHPIGHVLQAATRGLRPSPAELDALNLSAEHRRKVDEIARDAAVLQAEGANGDARALADERGVDLLAALPEAQQDPDYLKPPADEPDDPAALARGVQWW